MCSKDTAVMLNGKILLTIQMALLVEFYAILYLPYKCLSQLSSIICYTNHPSVFPSSIIGKGLCTAYKAGLFIKHQCQPKARILCASKLTIGPKNTKYFETQRTVKTFQDLWMYGSLCQNYVKGHKAPSPVFQSGKSASSVLDLEVNQKMFWNRLTPTCIWPFIKNCLFIH